MSRFGLIAAWLACLLQVAYFYRRLPASLPAHFNGCGVATSFAPKHVVLGIYLGATGFVLLMFLALGAQLAKTPDRRINLPNKAYWLARERRAATFATLTRWLQWFGVATIALFFDIFLQIFTVILGKARTLERAPYSVGAYVAFALIWLMVLMARFRRPTE